MRAIVGFGNTLRGEDGFGVDVVDELKKYHLKDTKLISVFQLTPELALELQEYDEIIFVDAAYSQSDHYALASNLEGQTQNLLSHHISIKMMISILNTLYNATPKYLVYSMLSDSFETISDPQKYNQNIIKVVKQLRD